MSKDHKRGSVFQCSLVGAAVKFIFLFKKLRTSDNNTHEVRYK